MDNAYYSLLTTDLSKVTFADGDEGKIRCRPRLPMSFPTGKVVCRDGFVASSAEGDSMIFAAIEPGTVDVTVSTVVFNMKIGKRKFKEVERGAGVVLKVSDAPIEAWAPARGTAEAPARFGVDYAWGCIMDASHQQLHNEWVGDSANATVVYEQDRPFLTLGEDKVLLFDCGLGDGAYPVWEGRDDNQNLVAIVIDLELLRITDHS